MLSHIKQLLLLTEKDLNSASVPLLQQSVLRIILCSGLLMVLGIAIHSSWQAYHMNAWYIIAITAVFYLVLLTALYFSTRLLMLGKALMLTSIFAASFCMMFFIDDFELSKLGIIFVYTAPLIALLFFNSKATVLVMLLNFIPFTFLVYVNKPINLFHFSITLPATHTYLHSLLFLFFNLCVPFAFMRVFSTLKRNSLTLKSQNQLISESNQLYQDIFNRHNNAALLITADGFILKANNKATQTLQLSEVEKHSIQELLSTPSASEHPFWLGHDIECTLATNAGIHLLLNHICTTQQQHHLIQLNDITQLKQLHNKLANSHQQQDLWRNYDNLTTLPNHNFFLNLIKQPALPSAGKLMMIIRLCHIKAFNHQHDYQTGDELLATFAKQLKATLPEDVIAARIRGVKFVLWRPLSEHCLSFTAEAERLFSLLPEELRLSVATLRPVYEAGVSVLDHTMTPEQVLEQCESALEHADAYNNPLAFYQPDTLQQRNSELQLLAELKTALRQHTPQLWLQPKVTPDGTISSFEALFRWQQADGSYAAPDKIVALAEQYGIIVQLSSYVLEKAVDIIRVLQQQKVFYPVAINLTGTDLLAAEFYNELVNIATHQSELLAYLTLELTENSIANHLQPLYDKLHALKKLGFELALDDFGTGQASLSMLNKLPVDTVKLDKSFLLGVPTNPRQTQLVQSVMLMTKALKLNLVIEGVETELQQRFLQSLGSQLMQGYLFSRPQPLSHWLAFFSQAGLSKDNKHRLLANISKLARQQPA